MGSYSFLINTVIIFSLSVIRFDIVWSQSDILQSPCPEIFSYHLNEKIYGKIQIPLRDWPMESLLNVTLTVAEQITTNYAGSLEPLKENPVNYIVHLPFTRNVPKVKEIYFNNNLICYGSPATGAFVTTVTLFNIYKKVIINGPQQTYFFNNGHDKLPPKEESNWYQPTRHPPVNQLNNWNSNHNINHIENNLPQTTVPTRIPEIIQPPTTTTPKYENEVVTNKHSQSFTSSIPDYDTESICGTTEVILPLISFGTEIIKGEYPWIAAIFKDTLDGIKFTCGGSLFTHQHIVTAAHCMQLNNRKTSKKSLSIFLGRHNVRKWSNDPDAIALDAEEILIHPQYSDINTDPNKPGLQNDIAVIKLDRRIKYANYIRPVCLWKKNPDINLIERRRGTVIGWGRDENGVEVSATPKQVQMPIVSEFECVRKNNQFAKFLSNTTFCAGNLDESGPCTGDSGSGFVLSENNRWTLRGIVSESLPDKEKKCDLLNYVIFTDVGQYYDWLYQFVSLDNNKI